jgi:hypothetical protein
LTKATQSQYVTTVGTAVFVGGTLVDVGGIGVGDGALWVIATMVWVTIDWTVAEASGAGLLTG